VRWRWQGEAAREGDRLGDKGRDGVGAFANEQRLEVAREPFGVLLGRLARLPPCAVGLRSMEEPRQRKAELIVVSAGQRGRGVCGAVVTANAGDYFHAARFAAGQVPEAQELEQKVVRLRAGGGESDARITHRHERRELLRQCQGYVGRPVERRDVE